MRRSQYSDIGNASNAAVVFSSQPVVRYAPMALLTTNGMKNGSSRGGALAPYRRILVCAPMALTTMVRYAL
jgi:hypothetical protein